MCGTKLLIESRVESNAEEPRRLVRRTRREMTLSTRAILQKRAATMVIAIFSFLTQREWRVERGYNREVVDGKLDDLRANEERWNDNCNDRGGPNFAIEAWPGQIASRGVCKIYGGGWWWISGCTVR